MARVGTLVGKAPKRAAKKVSAKRRNGGMTANQKKEMQREFLRVASAISVRSSIAARLGKSFGGDRDIYEALGYKTNPDFKDYMAVYARQDIARALIDKPVKASWKRPPTLTESADTETPFELAWTELVEKRKLFQQFSRVDRLACIGTYAILLLGFDDGQNLDQELTSARELLYATPYSMDAAPIHAYVKDTADERFGLPESYKITMKGSTTSREVHWTRIVHVSEDLLEDEVEGMPKLQAVLNRLQDLDLVVGGSAEMFWRGAFPGYNFKADADATLEGQPMTDVEDEIEEYMHGLKRYMRLQGVSAEAMATQVSDPSNHISAYLDLISAASGIPKRILMGSERGELASTMDEKNWFAAIESRQEEHCEPTIIRPFTDRLIEVGVLPTPKAGYGVDWPDLQVPGAGEKAKVGKTIAEALKLYDESGAEMHIPVEMFLKKVGFSDEEIEQAEVNAAERQKEDASG